MRILIVTDAWRPQVNGVVQTLSKTRDALRDFGHDVQMLTPDGKRTYPCPTYPEIRLALFSGASVSRTVLDYAPDCIHIATEGPLGFAARSFCVRNQIPFTSSYHTQFPEYLRARAPIPVSLSSRVLRWFHGAASRTLVPTHRIREKLVARKFQNVEIWSRGVDAVLFSSGNPIRYELPKPVWIHMGRIAVEKNIEQFLNLQLPGSKVVIGDGPDRERLQHCFPETHFLGYKFGSGLADHLAGADVFVFPSRTDTFGLVMLEAMACGLPVAAFPVEGPVDVVRHGVTGALHTDLGQACLAALEIDRNACRQHALSRSWERSTRQFEGLLVSRNTSDSLTCERSTSSPGP